MSIQRMIYFVKHNRRTIYVMFIILTIGIVGSYGLIGQGSYNGSNTTSDTEAQMSSYNTAITSARQQLAEKENDYTSIVSLAELLGNRANLAVTNNNTEIFQADAAEAAGLYEKALANAPTDLNNLGKANLEVKAAYYYWLVNNSAKAETLIGEALKLSPENYNIAAFAAQFYHTEGRTEDAIKVLNQYIASAAADDANVSSAKQQIEALQGILDEAKNGNTSDNSNADASSGLTDKADTAK